MLDRLYALYASGTVFVVFYSAFLNGVWTWGEYLYLYLELEVLRNTLTPDQTKTVLLPTEKKEKRIRSLPLR